MSTLEKAIYQFNVVATCQAATTNGEADSRIRLVVVIAFIAVTLSIPIDDPANFVWMLCYPIVAAESSGIGYGRIFIRSLWIVPLVALIGIFNPLLDTEAVWQIGSVTVTRGWLTFVSLIFRGLLTLQALLILIYTCGFYDICRCLQYFRCPKILVTQLLMLYRYIGVVLRESLTMHQARQARGFGKKNYPLREWGIFIGQLFLRSVNRARRVNNAMLARGFNGTYHFAPFPSKPKVADWAYAAIWIGIFCAIRFINLTLIFSHIFIR